jgi:hypothetical protein
VGRIEGGVKHDETDGSKIRAFWGDVRGIDSNNRAIGRTRGRSCVFLLGSRRRMRGRFSSLEQLFVALECCCWFGNVSC